MKPVLAELERVHGSALDVRSIDVLRRRHAITEWDVKAIPTQVFLDGTGREIERHVGFISADGVRSVFAHHGIVLPGVPRHAATSSPRSAP
jgi:thioredoxin 1